jgi:hypothetical protein
MTRYSEAWKALEDTAVYVPPSYPPPADPRAETHRYLEPCVPVFFGQRCAHPATLPCPATSQHAATVAYEALERTIDVGPASGVRTAAPNASSARRPTPDARAAGGGRALSVGGSVLVAALLVGCTNHDYVFASGLMSGITVGAVLVGLGVPALDRWWP